MSREENNSRSKLVPIIVFASVIIGVALYGFFFLGHEDNIIQGEAEVKEVRISGKVPGRIARILVEEGQIVKKGDTLAILNTPEVDAKMMQASAAEEGAAAISHKAIVGTRSEQVRSAYEMWQKAIVGVDIAEKSFKRVQNLFDQGVMTAQKRDEAEANYKASVATERAAKSQYDMAKNGAQREDKQAAEAQLRRAKGAVAEVASYVSESYLVSPTDGKISEIFPNEGELVGTGAPVMNVVKNNDKWGTFNVREDHLKEYKMNDVVKVFVPALDKTVDMKIYYIKDIGTYAAWKATKTVGQYDRKTFEVRARFADENIEIIPGMSLIIKN